MELGRGTLVACVVIAIAIGAGLAWQSRPAIEPAPASQHSGDSAAVADQPAAPTLYKWRDDNGVWNYTDKPPTGRDHELIRDTPNVTTVDSVIPEVPGAAAGSTIPPAD